MPCGVEAKMSKSKAPSPEIASTGNPRVHEWVRQREEHYLFAGEKLVGDLLARDIVPDLLLVEAGHPLAERWAGAARETVLVSSRVLAKVSGLVTPPPCLAVVHALAEGIPWAEQRVVWGLCGVQDPGNAGTLFRCAAAFGFSALALTESGVSPRNPKFLRAAQTSLFALRFARFPRLEDLLAEARAAGFAAVATGARPAGGGISPAELPERSLILLGSEGKGLPADLLASAPVLSIPQGEAVESLNVAVAGAILMHWVAGAGRG